MLGRALGEQAGFAFGQDTETDHLLVLRHDGETEAFAEVAGAHRSGGVGECVEDCW